MFFKLFDHHLKPQNNFKKRVRTVYAYRKTKQHNNILKERQ